MVGDISANPSRQNIGEIPRVSPIPPWHKTAHPGISLQRPAKYYSRSVHSMIEGSRSVLQEFIKQSAHSLHPISFTYPNHHQHDQNLHQNLKNLRSISTICSSFPTSMSSSWLKCLFITCFLSLSIICIWD